MFIKYQHIERFGTDETENINLGECYVFPKIDGTNGSIYMNGHLLSCGSRNRELTLENDNAGFYSNVLKDNRFINFFKKHESLRLYGEWLVPHSLKTYRDDTWNNFYVFDVVNQDGKYLTYEEYVTILDEFGIKYIPCIAKINNGSYEQFINIMDKNNYLIKDGCGVGDGIVIKRYDYINKYGRTTWAKIVTSEFKEKHIKEMGVSYVIGKKIIEEFIIETYLTVALIDKTFEKIRNESEWSSKKIPELLNRIWHDFINEEIWNIIKKEKNLKIDFKLLQYFLNKKIKESKKELF